MPTSADRGHQVRQQLLAAAAELIAELGWNAVTTRNLAERAGVRSGLVHYHFASLPALLRQAALDAIRPALAEARAVLSASEVPADGIAALLAHLDGYTGRDPESLLFAEAYLVATRDEELRARLAELVTEFRGELTAALNRAGHPAPDAAATLVMTVLDGFVLHKGLDPELSAEGLAPLVRDLVAPPSK
ncbi:TetR/AcrR family transcriptional regulator [Streptomyces sp. NPDC002851]